MIPQPGGQPGVTVDLAKLSMASSEPNIPVIFVTIQPSGLQKPFEVPEGGAPCDMVAMLLEEEFSPGSLHHAGSNTALPLLARVLLEAGSYDYKTFAVPPPLRLVLEPVFDSVEPWKWLLTEYVLETPINNLPKTAPDRIALSGCRYPLKLGTMELSALCTLLECDDMVGQRVKSRCICYAGTYTREQLLATPFDPRLISLNKSAIHQREPSTSMHLKYCEWNIRPELADFQSSLSPTAKLLPELIQPRDRGASGVPAVDPLTLNYVPSLNRILRFDALHANAAPYSLQHLKRGSMTDSEMEAIKAIPSLERQALAMMRHNSRIPDWCLCKTNSYDRCPAAVGDSKHVEKLMVFAEDGQAAPEYAMTMPGFAMEIWNASSQCVRTGHAPDVMKVLGQARTATQQQDPVQKDLRDNIEAVVKQVAGYCKDAGVRHGFFTNHYFTWGLKLEKDTAYITQAVPCTARDPSALQLIYYICTKGMQEAEAREAAAAVNQGSNNAAGDNPHSHPGGPPGGNDTMNDDGNGGSRDVAPADPRRSARVAERGTKTQQSTAEAADVLVSCDQQQTAIISDMDSAAAAARLIDLDLVQDFLGSGWSGLVFAYEMPDGRPAALKLADGASAKVVTLYHEAVTLLALQPEWGTWVAGLLAAGIGKDGHCIVLAVERIPDCSHLALDSDRDVWPQLQQALRAVHSHGVAHMDIRCENILVQRLADGSKKVWLIDWGFAALHATAEQQHQDWQQMHRLFGTTC